MLKDLFSKANYPLLMFLGFSGRLIVSGAGIGEAIALFAFAALLGYDKYIEVNREAPLNEAMKADLQELKSQVSAVSSAIQLAKTTTTARRF